MYLSSPHHGGSDASPPPLSWPRTFGTGRNANGADVGRAPHSAQTAATPLLPRTTTIAAAAASCRGRLDLMLWKLVWRLLRSTHTGTTEPNPCARVPGAQYDGIVLCLLEVHSQTFCYTQTHTSHATCATWRVVLTKPLTVNAGGVYRSTAAHAAAAEWHHGTYSKLGECYRPCQIAECLYHQFFNCHQWSGPSIRPPRGSAPRSSTRCPFALGGCHCSKRAAPQSVAQHLPASVCPSWRRPYACSYWRASCRQHTTWGTRTPRSSTRRRAR